MQIQILGCSGAIARGARTTSFLCGGRLLIDAGTGVGDLTVEAMAAIGHVCLTHAHLDHVAALPLMLDTIAGRLQRPLVVHALPETIAALRAHLFNGVIWPDFSAIPSPQAPFLRFEPLRTGDRVAIDGHRLEVLPARHTVPAVGYALDTPAGWWVYTGDTALCPAFWQRFNRLDRVAMLVIETAFSERERALACRSQHLCPSGLAQALAWLDDGPHTAVPIGLMHTKPDERARIEREVQALGLAARYRLQWLQTGQTLALRAA